MESVDTCSQRVMIDQHSCIRPLFPITKVNKRIALIPTGVGFEMRRANFVSLYLPLGTPDVTYLNP